MACKDNGDHAGEEIDALENKIGFNNGREDAAVIEFKEAYYEYGKIETGDIIEHEFEFSNTGKSDLFVLDVRTSCGCTIPEYSKEGIAPGGSGMVKIKFDSTDKAGKQNKKMTVISNAKNRSENIYLYGYVNDKK